MTTAIQQLVTAVARPVLLNQRMHAQRALIAPAASPRAHRNAGTVQDGRHLKPAMITTPLTETAARLHAAWSADTTAVEAVRPHAILVSLLGAATG